MDWIFLRRMVKHLRDIMEHNDPMTTGDIVLLVVLYASIIIVVIVIILLTCSLCYNICCTANETTWTSSHRFIVVSRDQNRVIRERAPCDARKSRLSRSNARRTTSNGTRDTRLQLKWNEKTFDKHYLITPFFTRAILILQNFVFTFHLKHVNMRFINVVY